MKNFLWGVLFIFLVSLLLQSVPVFAGNPAPIYHAPVHLGGEQRPRVKKKTVVKEKTVEEVTLEQGAKPKDAPVETDKTKTPEPPEAPQKTETPPAKTIAEPDTIPTDTTTPPVVDDEETPTVEAVPEEGKKEDYDFLEDL